MVRVIISARRAYDGFPQLLVFVFQTEHLYLLLSINYLLLAEIYLLASHVDLPVSIQRSQNS